MTTLPWWSRLFGWPKAADAASSVLTIEPASTPAGGGRVILGMPAPAENISISSLTQGYAPAGFDEMAGPGGIAPHWQPLLSRLEALSHVQRMSRVERINMRVRETGIAHDLFADPSLNAQPWRLDLVPLILPPDTWELIERGVVQRARLIEAILADIYGPQLLLKRGIIPPELVFSDPAFLRPCHGIMPTGGRIQFFAVDIARRPDGGWHVLDTHVETPAGIGYALANRTVLNHVASDLFSASKAVRLANYFQQMQEAMSRRINRADPSIALLTPGPRHNDFFSHAYLARYLGCLLVEGGDLRVENERVWLKTLDGLKPIDMILRCTAGGACDALELEPGGFYGPVGLVQAVRRQPDLVVNAVGTALAENRGLAAYLPAISHELLGESLFLPGTERLWLGDQASKAEVTSNLQSYFIRRAYEQTARPGRATPARDPSRLGSAERAALIREIELDGATLVAEKPSPLGTVPSYGPSGLEPKPFAVRIFATMGPNGFIVMPGGLAMTVEHGTSMALAAPDGASRDVWVLSDKPQPAFKSLWRPAGEITQVQRSPRELPSRTADNLYWLGRYIERADWTFRVLRICLSRIEEDGGQRQDIRAMRNALNNLLLRDGAAPVQVPPGLDAPQAIAFMAKTLLGSVDRPFGLARTLDHVHRTASLARDRLSLEAWRTLNAFYVAGRWQPSSLPSSISEQLDLIDAGLRVVAAFNGLTHENMTRNFGWSFLDMGRRLSRALNLAHLLLASLDDASPDDDAGAMLYVLELADSFITYRSRYRLNPMLPLVLDLLIVDETNPRSVAYQLSALASHIDALPQTGKGRGRTEVQRLALAMLSDVRLVDVAALATTSQEGRPSTLRTLLGTEIDRLAQLSDAITRRYFSVVEKEPMWVRARYRRER